MASRASGPDSDDPQNCALGCGKSDYSHDALSVDFFGILPDRDFGLKFVCKLGEHSCWTEMNAQGVDDFKFSFCPICVYSLLAHVTTKTLPARVLRSRTKRKCFEGRLPRSHRFDEFLVECAGGVESGGFQPVVEGSRLEHQHHVSSRTDRNGEMGH